MLVWMLIIIKYINHQMKALLSPPLTLSFFEKAEGRS